MSMRQSRLVSRRNRPVCDSLAGGFFLLATAAAPWRLCRRCGAAGTVGRGAGGLGLTR